MTDYIADQVSQIREFISDFHGPFLKPEGARPVWIHYNPFRETPFEALKATIYAQYQVGRRVIAFNATSDRMGRWNVGLVVE